MSDMPWKDAIIKILENSDSAMGSSDIAGRIVEDSLRTKVGATPANTVNREIRSSLKIEKNDSPFISVGRGQYFLRSKHVPNNEDFQEEDNTAIIRAFGMYWERESISWSSSPTILGVQQKGADPIDFSDQIGVYLLHDGRDVIYVGQTTDTLGKRLKAHTTDRLKGRWDRFSWFGLLNVTNKGKLENSQIPPTSQKVTLENIILTLEAVLIEGLEPPQNRRAGDNFKDIEYIQEEDPEIKKQQKTELLKDMLRSQ